jgi:hypothetical protein
MTCRSTAVVNSTSTPGNGIGTAPFAVSEAFERSSSLRPDGARICAAKAGEICAAGIFTRSIQVASVKRSMRGGAAGQ